MRIPFYSSFAQNRILGGAIALGSMQLGASMMGLIRDRTLATTFPGLDTVDVYIAAFRPSDLLFQVCIMAGFSVALVPLLARYHANNDPKSMGDFLSSVVGLAALVFGIIALVTAAVLPSIAHYIVGFHSESLDLYIQFARLALLSNFLFVFGNAFGQYLITVQRYWMYGITPIVYTLGTILGTVYLTPVVGPFGPMYGTLLGALVYVLIRFIAVVQHMRVRIPIPHTTFSIQHSIRWVHPDILEFLKLMWPRMLALGALQLQLLLFDTVASGLEVGSVTINAYARNFQSVAVGVVGIALAQSTFSLLSQAAAKRERKRFVIYLRKGIILLLALTIPGAIALVAFKNIAAMLVGLTHVLPVFSVCLALYAFSIPFESINHLLLRAFYATKHTITPAVFSVINGLSAIAVAWILAPQFGVYSLALGFTVGQIVQLIGLGLFLPKRVQKL